MIVRGVVFGVYQNVAGVGVAAVFQQIEAHGAAETVVQVPVQRFQFLTFQREALSKGLGGGLNTAAREQGDGGGAVANGDFGHFQQNISL